MSTFHFCLRYHGFTEKWTTCDSTRQPYFNNEYSLKRFLKHKYKEYTNEFIYNVNAKNQQFSLISQIRLVFLFELR